jgi:hypothetical protein
LIFRNLHHGFVHFLTHALLGMGAPLDTAEGVVIRHEATVLAGHLGIDGEQLNFTAALGASFFNNRGGSGFPLASEHCHNVDLLLFFYIIADTTFRFRDIITEKYRPKRGGIFIISFWTRFP